MICSFSLLTFPLFKIWKITQKRVRAMLKGHTAIVSCLAFLPDSRSLISSSYDQSLRIWCVRDGSLKRIINHTSFFFSVSLSQDGRYVTAANTDKSLRIWEVRTGRLVMSWTGHTENIWSTMLTPDGNGLLSGSQDKTMKYWDVTSLGSTLSAADDSGTDKREE
jgi:glucose repression regulatory protein TUP1